MEQIKNMTNPIKNYFQDIEQTAISVIAERFGKIGNAQSGDLNNLMKLQNINGDLHTIRKSITETVDKAKSEIYNIVESSARDYYEEAAKKHGVQLAPFEENHEILTLVEKTKREIFEKFSEAVKSDVIVFTNAEGEFKFLEQGYRETVNSAVTQIAKNAGEIDSLIESSIEALAESGFSKYNIHRAA